MRCMLLAVLFFCLFCIFSISVHADGVPRGMILIRVGDVYGWLNNNSDYVLCDSHNASLYPGLVPDLSGKFVVGFNASKTEYNMIGKTGGAESVSLSLSQMPAHDHFVPSTVITSITTTTYTANPGSTSVIRTISTSSNTAVRSQGSGIAHENRPPFYVVAFVCKVVNATSSGNNLVLYHPNYFSSNVFFVCFSIVCFLLLFFKIKRKRGEKNII